MRTQWRFDTLQYKARHIVCVNESGSDERTGDRRFGYSPKGVPAVVSRWLQSRTRVSVLPAYTVDGYIAATTFKGTCNADVFQSFIIDDVLPLMNPFPAPRSVLVMDNASIHHTNIDTIRDACEAKGVHIRFLPPYSPDLNLIEESFIDLKAFIRRYYK